MKPDDAATYERARRLANLAVWTVKVQFRRLHAVEPKAGKANHNYHDAAIFD